MAFSPVEPIISVIIPVHNGGGKFRRCLAGLAEAAPPPEEIVVVADGDTDGSWLVAEAFGANVLRTPTPGGPARARNLGARAARGNVLLFIDADVVIPSDAIAQIASAFRQEPNLAAVFGSYDADPPETNFLSQYKNLFHHYIHQTAREEASTFWGACGAIRRDIFLALGGFDERYRHPSIEDIELGYRLRQAGHNIRLNKALQVKHLKRWDVISLLESDVLHRALPWTGLTLRDRRFVNDLNLRSSSRFSVMIAYGLVGALIGGWRWPASFVVAGALGLVLLMLNAPLYRFFWQRRGLRFALMSVPWHWFYYVYGGMAFLLGVARHLFRKRASPQENPPGPPWGNCEKEPHVELR